MFLVNNHCTAVTDLVSVLGLFALCQRTFVLHFIYEFLALWLPLPVSAPSPSCCSHFCCRLPCAICASWSDTSTLYFRYFFSISLAFPLAVISIFALSLSLSAKALLQSNKYFCRARDFVLHRPACSSEIPKFLPFPTPHLITYPVSVSVSCCHCLPHHLMCLPDNRKQDACLPSCFICCIFLLQHVASSRICSTKNVNGLLGNPGIFVEICTHLRVA